MNRLRLLPLLLLCASAASAETGKVGCTPVQAAPVSAAQFEPQKTAVKGEGAAVARLADEPGVAWDLGEKRTARLSVYLTRECALGMRTSVASGGESSSPDPNSAVADFAERMRRDAPDWTLTVTPPNTITAAKGAASYTTDLRKLLALRLDAATPVTLNGVPVRVLFDGWLLFIVPEDARKSLNLSVRSTVYPWAYYDLTPYGLPRLVARFDDGKAVLWALP
jgi:hypothetical protein